MLLELIFTVILNNITHGCTHARTTSPLLGLLSEPKMWILNNASVLSYIWHERFLLDDLAGCQALQMFQSLLLSNYGGFTNSSATDRLPFTASNSFYSCVGLFVVFGLNICNNILISTYIKGWLFNEERIKYKCIHEDRLYQTCPISYSGSMKRWTSNPKILMIDDNIHKCSMVY